MKQNLKSDVPGVSDPGYLAQNTYSSPNPSFVRTANRHFNEIGHILSSLCSKLNDPLRNSELDSRYLGLQLIVVNMSLTDGLCTSHNFLDVIAYLLQSKTVENIVKISPLLLRRVGIYFIFLNFEWKLYSLFNVSD